MGTFPQNIDYYVCASGITKDEQKKAMLLHIEFSFRKNKSVRNKNKVQFKSHSLRKSHTFQYGLEIEK